MFDFHLNVMLQMLQSKPLFSWLTSFSDVGTELGVDGREETADPIDLFLLNCSGTLSHEPSFVQTEADTGDADP